MKKNYPFTKSEEWLFSILDGGNIAPAPTVMRPSSSTVSCLIGIGKDDTAEVLIDKESMAALAIRSAQYQRDLAAEKAACEAAGPEEGLMQTIERKTKKRGHFDFNRVLQRIDSLSREQKIALVEDIAEIAGLYVTVADSIESFSAPVGYTSREDIEKLHHAGGIFVYMVDAPFEEMQIPLYTTHPVGVDLRGTRLTGGE